ncbi:MAG: hypothetical protein CVV42_07230 [Candidatus Riflebacteria bacterium HGW-Riflebacteria-2]|jgi:RimJ/RimL family protein N-acetyltransferase/dTDP-4-dehydrorhamnose 3,5-epimerase-like enzyme|nr:MAG: hypothetical protein CVV42_07230 [Candidatus Riflebacteria bacterium HGW-Riflebacteria-2]
MDIKFYDLPIRGDEYGSLIAIEGNKDIPFEIKRAYYIFATKMNVWRGFHAHKELEQIAVCVAGSCKFHLDDGYEKAEVLLNSSSRGLYVGKMIWHEMYDFSPDCILLILASLYYDLSDYVRDYEEFKESSTKVALVKFDRIFLDLSWHWLNDPEINQMTMSGIFSRKDQLHFFESLDKRTDYIIFGIRAGVNAGACGLKNIRDGSAELFMYIGEKQLWRKGIGSRALELLENHGIQTGLQRIWLKVSRCNLIAINFYLARGYRIASISSEDERFHLMEKSL